MCDSSSEIIQRTIEYMTDFLEQPHPIFGGLPVCPFTRKARLSNQILYKVDHFDINSSLNLDSTLIQSIQEFHQNQHDEVLLVLHPDSQALTPEQTQEFINCLNPIISSWGLVAFGGHPDESFNIQGVYTRRLPYINLTIQAQCLLTQASETLLKTKYYQNWTPENLKNVGFPRSH
ncbi:hypothetical protein [Lyngbya sp. PCC 8106]|uniref:hypothetical protein n=1 Tax=Lyngbya sp. (strain PCC 8106) TaxID=313612 RepID=UPI0000EACF0E|nr:hypothetical protein [Lyngbya sp. PCC 8106]EAW33856.1 hypothetical protein L8106_29330 [Lyngbya sp. PCC 8106]